MEMEIYHHYSNNIKQYILWTKGAKKEKYSNLLDEFTKGMGDKEYVLEVERLYYNGFTKVDNLFNILLINNGKRN